MRRRMKRRNVSNVQEFWFKPSHEISRAVIFPISAAQPTRNSAEKNFPDQELQNFRSLKCVYSTTFHNSTLIIFNLIGYFFFGSRIFKWKFDSASALCYAQLLNILTSETFQMFRNTNRSDKKIWVQIYCCYLLSGKA